MNIHTRAEIDEKTNPEGIWTRTRDSFLDLAVLVIGLLFVTILSFAGASVRSNH